eukprot:2393777-Rhodomonas_salina.2
MASNVCLSRTDRGKAAVAFVASQLAARMSHRMHAADRDAGAGATFGTDGAKFAASLLAAR